MTLSVVWLNIFLLLSAGYSLSSKGLRHSASIIPGRRSEWRPYATEHTDHRPQNALYGRLAEELALNNGNAHQIHYKTKGNIIVTKSLTLHFTIYKREAFGISLLRLVLRQFYFLVYGSPYVANYFCYSLNIDPQNRPFRNGKTKKILRKFLRSRKFRPYKEVQDENIKKFEMNISKEMRNS